MILTLGTTNKIPISTSIIINHQQHRYTTNFLHKTEFNSTTKQTASLIVLLVNTKSFDWKQFLWKTVLIKSALIELLKQSPFKISLSKNLFPKKIIYGRSNSKWLEFKLGPHAIASVLCFETEGLYTNHTGYAETINLSSNQT